MDTEKYENLYLYMQSEGEIDLADSYLQLLNLSILDKSYKKVINIVTKFLIKYFHGCVNTEYRNIYLKGKRLQIVDSIFDRYTIIPQDWNFEQIFKEAFPLGWSDLFTLPQVLSAVIKNDRLIKDKFGGSCIPLKSDLLRAFNETPLNQVKVVIIGQEPYQTVYDNKPQSIGFSFSTRKGTPIQQSLYNIFLELKNTIPNWEKPNHGDLTKWARQGVLLLNNCLTTYPGKTHGSIWKGIIIETIKLIREKRPKTIFILWGNDAQGIIKNLGNLKYLEGSHPNSTSVKGGFFGGNYFNLANEHLISNGLEPVDWSL